MSPSVPALSVDADLDVTVDGNRCRVWSEADCLVVNAPSLSAARSLLGGLDALPVPRQLLVGELGRVDLTVEIRVRHAPVARVGSDVTPSRVAELAGYDAEVSTRGVAVAAYRALL